MSEHKLNTRFDIYTRFNDALEYMIGKKAIYTIVNEKSGNRFTFMTREKKSLPGILCIYVLTGPDNTRNYSYLGYINKKNWIFKTSTKSDLTIDSPSFRAFEWVYENLKRDTIPSCITILHYNRCCRCGRILTRPHAITAGIGDDCAAMRELQRN